MVTPAKTAHFIWGGSELPDEYAKNIEQFEAINKGWTTRLWDGDEARGILPVGVLHLFDDAAEFVPADSVWQFRSDLARLAILGKHGGLYVDTDFRWQKPIESLLAAPPRTVVTAWEVDRRHVANAFIYSAQRGHSIFRQCLRDAPGRAHQQRGMRANRITGPSGQWTAIARRRHDVKILPSKLLYPYAWNELGRASEEFPEAYGVHVWGHQISLRGRQGRQAAR